MRVLSERIADSLVSNNVLTEEDKPLYSYGLHQMGMTALNLATTVVIGVFFHMVWQCLVFLALYIPLRRVAGGYHAKTEFRCYIVSNTILCMALSAMHSIVFSAPILFLIVLLSGTMIFILAPVESLSKPLDATERRVYRKRSRIILLAHFGAAVAALFVHQLAQLIFIMAMADLALAVMLVIGLVDNGKKSRGDSAKD